MVDMRDQKFGPRDCRTALSTRSENLTLNICLKKAIYSLGTSCDPITDTCGSSSLTTCSSSSSTCTCLSTSSLVSYSNSFYCADTQNATNCGIFPTRCVTWCNSTTNYLCICPIDTLKIQRNSLYVCELPVDSLNCSINDSIRRCPLGQNCNNGQCIDDITTTATTTTEINNSNE
jgi:hypothetical protein